MKQRVAAALIAALFLTTTFLSAGAPRVRRPDLFLKVWRPFRAAVLAENADAIRPLTHFPVQFLSDAGTEKRSAKDLATWFPVLLKSPSGVKPRQTVKQFVAGKEDLVGAELDALRAGEVQLGPLVFRRHGDKWLFTAARVDGSAPPPPPTIPTPPARETVETSIIESVPTDEPAPPAVEIIDEEIPTGLPTEKPTVAPGKPRPAPAKPSPTPTAPPPAAPAGPSTEEGFRGFWRLFRDAVLANDLTMVKNLTKFSFETRGARDGSPLKKHSARDFDLLYLRLLQTDPKTGPLRDNMRELIWRKQDLTVNEIGTADSLGEIHVGIFVFKRAKGRWLFIRANVDD